MKVDFTTPSDPEIKKIVRHFFQIAGGTSIYETILPKGCIEILFNFVESNQIIATLAGNTTVLPKCFISGFNTCPKYINHSGYQHYFGIILQPGAIKYLLGVKGFEFANKYTDLILIDAHFNTLWHEMAEHHSFNERIDIVNKWILKQNINQGDREIMINNFLNNGMITNINVSELAQKLCYSSRQLARKMLELTGMNSEQLLCYQKFLRSLDLIHTSDLSLTEIAYESHFSDQSHFSNTFNSFAKISPKDYRKIKSNISGHYFQDVR